jgi:hypothetical protein
MALVKKTMALGSTIGEQFAEYLWDYRLLRKE